MFSWKSLDWRLTWLSVCQFGASPPGTILARQRLTIPTLILIHLHTPSGSHLYLPHIRAVDTDTPAQGSLLKQAKARTDTLFQYSDQSPATTLEHNPTIAILIPSYDPLSSHCSPNQNPIIQNSAGAQDPVPGLQHQENPGFTGSDCNLQSAPKSHLDLNLIRLEVLEQHHPDMERFALGTTSQALRSCTASLVCVS